MVLQWEEQEVVNLPAPRPADLCCIVEMHKHKGPDKGPHNHGVMLLFGAFGVQMPKGGFSQGRINAVNPQHRLR